MKLKNNVSENSLRRTFVEQGFDESQIRFLVNSVNENVDIRLFANTKFSYEKMRALKDGIALGFDMTSCAKEYVTVQEIRREIRRRIWLIEYDVSAEVRNAYFEYVDLIGE